MLRQPGSRTRVEDVYQQLKDDICQGRLVPGAKVNLGEFSKANQVSLTVVREAATRLASDRLLELSPQQGFRVWPLSIPDLLDLTRVRIEIETLALRESIQNADLGWEADLLAAHHRLEGAVNPAPGHPSGAWLEAHAEFHAAVASACTSPLLKRMRQQLFDSAELYRLWSANAEPPKKRRQVAKEHAAIKDAAMKHDVDLVVRLSVEHIQRTTDLLLKSEQAQVSA